MTLPEFTWLASYSAVTDHNLFQHLNPFNVYAYFKKLAKLEFSRYFNEPLYADLHLMVN